MFNHEAWAEQLADMKAQIQSGPPDWLKTVNARYGAFMVDQTVRQIETIMRQRGQATLPDADKRLLNHVADELMKTCSMLHAGAALIRGAVISPDPLQCEAVMRLAQLSRSNAAAPEA
jgi:hypothetical protein